MKAYEPNFVLQLLAALIKADEKKCHNTENNALLITNELFSNYGYYIMKNIKDLRY